MAVMEQHGPDASGLLTPLEVAQVLRVSTRTVRRLGANGRLERIYLGHRTVRYTHTSVAALIHPHNDVDPAANGADVQGARSSAHAKP